MNVKHYQIREIFIDINKLKQKGIWMTGEKNYGEFKRWYKNGIMVQHAWFTNGVYDGELKMWNDRGRLVVHKLFDNDKELKNYLK